MTHITGTVLALVNHPNLDLLLGPVLKELQDRGHAVKALVVEAGRPNRLAELGVPLVDELTEFDEFLARPGPRVMINAADLIPLHKLGIHTDMLCQGAGVPTLTLEHAPFGILYGDVFLPRLDFAADVMTVIGQRDKEGYEAMGVDPQRLIVTGAPAFDHLVRARPEAATHLQAKDIAIFGQSHTWVGPGSSQGLDPDAWRDQLTLLYRTLCARYPEAQIKVKPHPAEPFHKTDVLYHEAIPTELGQQIVVLPPDTDNAQLIFESRFVISFSSTIWLETKILGCPCAFFSLQERHGRLAHDLPALGGVWITGKSVDFVARLLPHLADLEAQSKTPEVVDRALLEKYTGPLDGKSTARVAGVAEELMTNGSPNVPRPILVFDGPGVFPRRLRPQQSYADYVHLQMVADQGLVPGVQHPFVLAVSPPGIPLRQHMPLAQYTLFNPTEADSTELPFADDSFDVVVAPDLFLYCREEQREEVLAELLRVTRLKVVTSLPSGLGRNQLGELAGLVELEPDLSAAWGVAGELEGIASWLRQATNWQVSVRECHQVMSWSQSLIIEHCGLDENALGTLRLSAQATGYPFEGRGFGVRHIYSFARKG